MVFELRPFAALAAALTLLACSAALDGGGSAPQAEPGVTPPPGTPPEDDPPPVDDPVDDDAEPVVFLKDGGQLEADLAQGLALSPGDVCQELGERDCVEVHRIVLGGVEPYTLRIDEPLSEPSPTTPLAIERLAWGACERAVARDLGAGPTEVFVRGPAGLDRVASARRLAERLLHRAPEAAQVNVLADFGPQLDDEAWALSTCVAVASSFDSIFY